MDAVVENWHEPANFDQAKNKELYRKQTRRFAELALKRYNKNKNNKVNHFNVLSYKSVISSVKAVRMLVDG
jgi:hypothetical protein